MVADPTPPTPSLPSLTRPFERYIDHTLLKPDAPTGRMLAVVEEAAAHRFATVCLPPCHVAAAAEILADHPATGVCTVIAFPFGYADPEARLAESLHALEDGADELDTVINLSRLKAGEAEAVAEDLERWVEGVRRRAPGAVLKVILETALLTEREKVLGAKLALAAGADFVKTSTGFGGGGATVADVELLAGALGGRARIKASGGIRSAEDALALIAAGADRLGTSSGPALLEGYRRLSGGATRPA